MPTNIAQPADYPAPRESIQLTKITTADRIDYFARSSSMQLGQIKNLYLKWARRLGPLSSQCQELNRLFSQCVDASKITIPERLKDAPEPLPGSEFILDVLHTAAIKRTQQSQELVQVTHLSSIDQLVTLLTEPTGHTQFELACVTLQWCQKHHVPFEELSCLLDPTQLSSEEKTWLTAQLPTHEYVPETINSDLLHSSLLGPQELSFLGLRGARVKWKVAYASERDRLANLLDVFRRVFPFVTRKLLVLRIHDRLSIAVYIPVTIQPEDETSLGPRSRLFAIPHGKDDFTGSRVTVPTKHNSRFYYDDTGFQLYEGKRANTFVYLTRAANNTSRYQNARGRGQRARIRQETIDEGINQEWRASIALNKFSQNLATHVGRLWREGVAAAELYVISNADQRSSRNLDLWLEQIDTDQTIDGFAADNVEPEVVQRLGDLDLHSEPVVVRRLLENATSEALAGASAQDVGRALELAWQTSSPDIVNELFTSCVSYLTTPSTNGLEILTMLLDFLSFVPAMVIHFVRLSPWANLGAIGQALSGRVHDMLSALVLCTEQMGQLAVGHIGTLLDEVPQMSITELQNFIELVALTVSSPETVLNILMEHLEPSASRVLLLTPKRSHYVVNRLSAIALDHVEEAADAVKESSASSYRWKFDQAVARSGKDFLLTCDYRIDAPTKTRLAVGDHLRFVCVQCPETVFISHVPSFETLVEKSELGRLTLRCLRHPPAIYRQCMWQLEHCGSFVTAQTMMDAVAKLVSEKERCCKVYEQLMTTTSASPVTAQPTADISGLNLSQQAAVVESIQRPITSIWGPPGTGKTQTMVSIINELLSRDTERRLLVTAPTHNAVDNVLRRYLQSSPKHTPVRVSTDVHKVSADLRTYTCDAMVGRDVNQYPAARRNAQKQISQARLVFTTCIGAGLGFLRDEVFDDVVIDEASQQTEPASLVPIVKGCSRLVLVGDHVQLRATVRPHAATLGFDVSLFESLWINDNGVGKVMLDTQYRMHPSVCKFPSDEFYQGRLQTAAHCEKIPVPSSAFAWPRDHRTVFVQSSAPEDLGRKSKSNTGQATICQTIISQLRTPPDGGDHYSIAILTPYTRQVQLLQRLLPDETVSSIDGFQGQEADVVVYVSVRCNAHGDIGFLRDMRRLNVALTRARAGVVIIGDRVTLTGRNRTRDPDRNRDDGEEEETYHATWARLIDACCKVDVVVPEDSAGS